MTLGAPSHKAFPSTRYQGSKLKLLGWLWNELGSYSFESALDLFGGTAAVSYLFKTKGKRVTFNDLLRSNCVQAEALIGNASQPLSEHLLASLFYPHPEKNYDDFVARTFEGVFYTTPENRVLDIVVQNIEELPATNRGIAFYALFQACLAKRPYNLFHRANLYMRLAHVERSFGNKVTWERSFQEHMRAATQRANAAIFNDMRTHTVVCRPAEQVDQTADLIYLDPPYINNRKIGTDYLNYYHFLEGLVQYREWSGRIDKAYKHLPFRRTAGDNPWQSADGFIRALDVVIEKHRQSIIVISYRADGFPGVDELRQALRRHKKQVRVATSAKYQYALAKTATQELLFIGE